MNRSMMIALLVGLVLCAVVIEQAEAGGGLRWARLAKLALIARALKGKKIYLPLPLPLPIPLFKENIHHEPVPVNHHTKAVIGYGLEQPHHGGHQGWY
ncbi:uncharacterized protein TNIN_438551 [Trichonephila inaurata madagascariensis]|uniref:Uncharacterized protein n=1 Tax=Trichonephila inaurata madagascariensis TaxID=2747483 RepID=A0A8X7CNM4_9ARAC|nr:uncharacterized protein TNIN_438551 [Trichonephila inaurata madagascariensis]